jgi:hypothetical protein
MTFEEANEKIHPVEKQWHYPILTKHGFVAKTLEGKGFVRSYKYEHPNGLVVTATTGAERDYWQSSAGGYGLWRDLEPHINKFMQ